MPWEPVSSDGSEASGTENPTFAYPNSYTFKTASEWTFSGSYVFGQFGLLSVDYMLKDYSKMRFKNPGFERENEIIKDQMKNIADVARRRRSEALSPDPARRIQLHKFAMTRT